MRRSESAGPSPASTASACSSAPACAASSTPARSPCRKQSAVRSTPWASSTRARADRDTAGPVTSSGRRAGLDPASDLGEPLRTRLDGPPALDPPGGPGRRPRPRLGRVELHELAGAVRFEDDVVGGPGQPRLGPQPVYLGDE